MEQWTNDDIFYNIEWKSIDFVNLISVYLLNSLPVLLEYGLPVLDLQFSV